MNKPASLFAPIADLLARAGIEARIDEVAPCGQSGNNRIFRVATTAEVFAVKQYFRHENDKRDRLAAEHAFLRYASTAAPEMTPRPYTCNPETGLALHEFVDGRPFLPGEITLGHVDSAIRFFRALNALPLRGTAELPVASEACFSVAEHLALIGGRIDQLLEVEPRSDVDSDACNFLPRLGELWRQLAEDIRRDASAMKFDVDEPLIPEQRCISPSDFGFHNALLAPGGAIRFIDFEYAGWDDPAKAAGDFFAQLAVPVPSEHFRHFVDEIMQDFPHPDQLAARATLLKPAYQVKWCCIALNVFLPVHLARRKFADPAFDESALKQAQLAKAKNLFNSIRTSTHGLY